MIELPVCIAICSLSIYCGIMAICAVLSRVARAIEKSNAIAADQAQFVDLNKMRKP